MCPTPTCIVGSMNDGSLVGQALSAALPVLCAVLCVARFKMTSAQGARRRVRSRRLIRSGQKWWDCLS